MIERFADWGENGPLPENGVVATSDRAAALAITNAYDGIPPVGLVSTGDLRRTLGGRRTRGQLRHPDAARAVVDYGLVRFNDTEVPFVAHVVARKSFMRGRIIAVMNAAFVGSWNVAPRSHPGDGMFEVLHADLSFSDRLKARRRLPSGTHVPHPGITQERGTAFDFSLEQPLNLWADGKQMGEVHSFSIELVPEALAIVV